MEAKNVSKIREMIMCGDHPSVIPSEELAKRNEAKEVVNAHPRVEATSSRTEKPAKSEHAFRAIEARRRVRSMELMETPDVDVVASGNRSLVQAALGSMRWPPYLVAVWVLVLCLTHVIHALVAALDRALPNIRKCCQYLRAKTEEAWRSDSDVNNRVYPIALAFVTGVTYLVYCSLYIVYSVAVWAIEPLCGEVDDEPKVTNYIQEVTSHTNASLKQ